MSKKLALAGAIFTITLSVAWARDNRVPDQERYVMITSVAHMVTARCPSLAINLGMVAIAEPADASNLADRITRAQRDLEVQAENSGDIAWCEQASRLFGPDGMIVSGLLRPSAEAQQEKRASLVVCPNPFGLRDFTTTATALPRRKRSQKADACALAKALIRDLEFYKLADPN